MKIKVTYILGYGRSGSTILGTLLGSHADAFNVGEMIQLPREGWQKNNYCSCGVRGNDCEFWSAVQTRWKELAGLSVDDYVEMQKRYLGATAAFPLLRPALDGDSNVVLNATAALYQSVAEVSGKNIIIDSSKMPQWAFAVAALPNVDMRVVHLVRDGRGTAYSLSKAYERDDEGGVQMDIAGRSVWGTAWRWQLYNILSEYFLTASHVPALRLRYEDFVSNPSDALDAIGHLAEMDYASVDADLKAEVPLSVEHAIAGNRLRMNKALTLRPDVDWQQKLSAANEFMFWAAAAPMAFRYGYRPRLFTAENF